jgi:DNA (cytosine-5)-methyltransferase 1
MVGDRDKAWGKQKHFNEGQKLQTLDDLVFVYCETILKLQPKVFLLENVKGIIAGNAKSYTKRIGQYLTSNGYTVQVFCLNAATMGVPQARERVFFIGHKKEYSLPSLKLAFNEPPITFSQVKSNSSHNKLRESQLAIWNERRYGDKNFGDTNIRRIGKANQFNSCYLYLDKCSPTLTSTTAQNRSLIHFDEPWCINEEEIKSISTFPQDYQSPTKDIGWLCGMSVPPVMIAQISHQIYLQWLSKINANN